MNILECSTAGDKRYSAFCAYVNVNGVNASIEDHYQNAKLFETPYGLVSVPRKQAKGRKPHAIGVGGFQYDVKYLSAWYKTLWIKYLDEHPDLVDYASQFDDFSDKFKGNSLNCQADVIRQYIKQGRYSVILDCQEFWSEARKNIHTSTVSY